MPTNGDAKLQELQAQARLCDLIEVSANDTGVTIRHSALGLGFHHSLISGPMARRAAQSRQAILKACNNKSRSIRRVLDLTAGWGGDGLTLACHGLPVSWLEQNPLVRAVIDYSLSRLAAESVNTSVAELLHLESGDALEFLQALPDRHDFDCIILDPMFPSHKSTAKPAKDLQILQAITENRDIDAIFELALKTAHKRVVVKRPLKAKCLSEAEPDICYREKSIRFDVYLTG